jgi:hypothetical protein
VNRRMKNVRMEVSRSENTIAANDRKPDRLPWPELVHDAASPAAKRRKNTALGASRG